MRIDELDEWQGVTPDMVREWLRNRGWSLHGEMPRYWEKGSRNFADSLIDGNSDDLAFVIHCEEIAAGLARQEALRQINPRMHKGMPSEAARDAHGGPWVGHMGGEFPLLAIGYWHDGSFNAGLVSWDEHKVKVAALSKHPCAFWPCDANGHKLRWPTDANGAML